MTHPPGAEHVTVATGALRNEAREWDTQSTQTGELSAEVFGMEFGRLEAGLFQMMVGPYNDVIHGVSARCREGGTSMTQIADTLRAVADTYDAEDQASMHRFKNLY